MEIKIAVIVNLLMICCHCLEFEGIEPGRVMVRSGDNVTLRCGSDEDQDWFFCLWRHPAGGKECSVQESGERRAVCGGGDDLEMEVIGSSHECDLNLGRVRVEDHGHYMCMLTQADTYHTRQTWTLVDVAVPDTIILDSISHNVSDHNILEMIEGDQVQLECSGSGSYPAPHYSWSVNNDSIIGDTITTNIVNSNTVNTISRLNFTGNVDNNGTIITCYSVQYNTYTGEMIYYSSSSITIIIHLPILQYLSITQSRSSIITLSFVSLILIILTVSVVMVFVIRKRKSPPSSNVSSCSDPEPPVHPVWTSNCQENVSMVKDELRIQAPDPRVVFPKYIHPLSPTFMVTSTPVRNESSSFVFNVTQCLDTSENNHSIGDIVDGNFVSFSTSDLYCISNIEEGEDANEDKNDPSYSKTKEEKETEVLESLCESCRSSFCSNVSSSTLTLAPSEIENDSNQESCASNNITDSTLSLKTLNVDDLSNCESIVTIETIDEDFDDQPGKYTNIVEAEANNIAEDETNNVVVPEAEHIVEINTAYENINTDLLNSV